MSLSATIKAIRDRSVKEKGAYIPYSQCIEPTATLINMMPQTKNGICQALAAKWIAEHANGGSLFNWLCTPGTTNVKQSAITSLMVNFTESVTSAGKLANQTEGIGGRSTSSGLYHQDFITEKYLQLYGLKRRGSMGGSTVGSMASQLSTGATGNALASRFQPSWMNTKGEAYILVSIMGSGGHALAGYVAGSEVILFDPNYGEFYFPKFENFFKWFLYFYPKSGYAKAFPKFYLLGFAKDATGKWGKYK
jgi:YopT-type cysteine protease-like protein